MLVYVVKLFCEIFTFFDDVFDSVFYFTNLACQLVITLHSFFYILSHAFLLYIINQKVKQERIYTHQIANFGFKVVD